jgi:hypothetical protein
METIQAIEALISSDRIAGSAKAYLLEIRDALLSEMKGTRYPETLSA